MTNKLLSEKLAVLPPLLTVPELAKVLRIGKNAAYSLVNSGEIRCIHIGKSIRIPLTAVAEYLSCCQTIE